MANRRIARVSELVQQVVAELVLRDIKDPRLTAVTITGAKVSADLSIARIYYRTIDATESADVQAALESAQGFIRRELGKKVKLRRTPGLTFHFDASTEYGHKMDSILHELRERGEMGEDE